MANFGKLNFAVSFNPQTAFPLDARSYFEDITVDGVVTKAYDLALAAAQKAAVAGDTNTVYYFGQTLVVNDGAKATLYIIQPDKTLKEVGSTPAGDDNSITVDGDKIKLVGFDSADAATYPRKTASGKLEWVTVQELVEGATENTITVGDNKTIVSKETTTGYELSIKGFADATVGQIATKGDDGIVWSTITVPEVPVKSVNGKTGDVVITAAELGALTEHQDISGKVDRSELSGYYTKTEADAEFMTQGEVDARIDEIIKSATSKETLDSLVELVEYIDQHGGEAAEMATAIENLENNKADKTDVYTKGEVDALIPSLTGYATESWVEGKKYATEANLTALTEIVNGKADSSALDNYYTKNDIDGKGFLTEHQDISNKVDRDELNGYQTKITSDNKLDYSLIDNTPDLTVYLTQNDLVTYATTKSVEDAVKTLGESIKAVEDKIPTNDDINALISTGLTGYATEDFVTGKGYITESVVDNKLVDYVKTSDLPAPYITSVDTNNFSVEEGKLSVTSINVNQLVQTEGEELVLNGGNASNNTNA